MIWGGETFSKQHVCHKGTYRLYCACIALHTGVSDDICIDSGKTQGCMIYISILLHYRATKLTRTLLVSQGRLAWPIIVFGSISGMLRGRRAFIRESKVEQFWKPSQGLNPFLIKRGQSAMMRLRSLPAFRDRERTSSPWKLKN